MARSSRLFVGPRTELDDIGHPQPIATFRGSFVVDHLADIASFQNPPSRNTVLQIWIDFFWYGWSDVGIWKSAVCNLRPSPKSMLKHPVRWISGHSAFVLHLRPDRHYHSEFQNDTCGRLRWYLKYFSPHPIYHGCWAWLRRPCKPNHNICNNDHGLDRLL